MRATVAAVLTVAVLSGCAGADGAQPEPDHPAAIASPSSEVTSPPAAPSQSPSDAGGTSDAPAAGPLTATRKPIPVDGGGSSMPLRLTGYGPGSSAVVRYGSSEIATLTATRQGVLTGPLTLPPAPPGVQVLSVRGGTAGGVAYGHDLRLLYPGSPELGQDYSVYVDGFEVRPEYIESSWTPDEVTVTYGGMPLFSQVVDVEGGVLVTVPIPDFRPARPIDLLVTSTHTGLVRKVLLDPEP